MIKDYYKYSKNLHKTNLILKAEGYRGFYLSHIKKSNNCTPDPNWYFQLIDCLNFQTPIHSTPYILVIQRGKGLLNSNDVQTMVYVTLFITGKLLEMELLLTGSAQ